MIVHYSLSFLRYQEHYDDKKDLNKCIHELTRMGKQYYFDDKYSTAWFYVTEDDGVTIINPKGREDEVIRITEPRGVKMYEP